ncbi:MAG: alkaline phosphatase [Pseudomonadales bacterium]|nr:alkaline phosphatase [Pseudomonadales bacterium]
MKCKTISSVAALLLTANLHADVMPDHQINNDWYQDAHAVIQQKLQLKPSSKAKNVILFVGDGMGISTLTASRILQGQLQGENGEEAYLSFERFPYSAQIKTYNVDAQTPDSAGTMTAMMSGVKTDAGVIGVNENIQRGDCASMAGNTLITALELAEIKGLATGIISTARITHATPAATYAKSVERNWEDNSAMPTQAIADGCEDIATQLIHFEKNLEQRYPGIDVDGIDVSMGGGRRHFLPNDATFNSPDARSDIEGDRTDGRNLIQEWQDLYPHGNYIMNLAQFNAIETVHTQKLFALFNESHMAYESDRGNDIAGEPSLSAMTKKAIAILDNNPKGFFLMVESGRIDHAHHAGNAYKALTETLEFSKAVQQALVSTHPEETLILVTADHGHVFTIGGYPKRGNPILGKVVNVGETEAALAEDGMPYTTLSYANGRGFRDFSGRNDLSQIDTQAAGFHQEATVPLSSESHAGEDIALHATGPGSYKVQGVIEQNVVFHLMNQALGLIQSASGEKK